MEYQGFVNRTPFAAQPLLLADERGADVFVCVVKGTFAIAQRPDGASLSVADEQVPPCLAPVYNGDDPMTSSLRYDLDVAPVKLGTDVVLVGHAYPPHAGASHADVSLAVGPARLVVRAFGDRVWTSTMGRWAPSAPAPFAAIPLVYERAFGGWDRSNPDPARHEYDPRNPVGVGFVSKKHGTVREGAHLPNLENPYEPITSPSDHPTPVGFGFIGPHWHPRARFAGTYDDRWTAERMPLLPDDFDRKFYNAAHPALALQGYLQGGEPVEVLNGSPQRVLRFWLPVIQLAATVRMKDGSTHRLPMLLDTVIINTDEDRLFLVWRAALSVNKRVQDVLWAKADVLHTAGT